MLMTIFLILGIAAVGLHLLMAYIVPVFNRAPESRLSALVLFCFALAALAIVLALLVGFHVVVFPSGY